MAEEVLNVFKADYKDYLNGLKESKKGLEGMLKAETDLISQQEKRLDIYKEELDDLKELRRRRDEALDPKEVSEYNKRINETRTRIQGLSKDIEDSADAVESYSKEVKESTEKTKQLGKVGEEAFGLLDRLTFGLAGKFKNLITTTAGLTKGMGLLRTAVISTGIGALVVAVASLIAYFTQTQRGADLLSRSMKGLGAGVDVLVDRASALGEAIINAFKNPQKALKDFQEALKTFVSNRIDSLVKGFTGLGTVIKKVFERDFKGALKTGSQAALDLVTGIDPIAGLIRDNADAIKELANEIGNEAKAAYELEAASQRVRDAQIQLNVERAKSRAIIKELNLIAEDVSRSEDERIAAAEKALGIEQGLLNQRVELAKQNVEIIKQQNALGESMIEDVERLADAETELANIREESLELQTTINNKINAIRVTALAAEKKAAEEIKQLYEDINFAAEEALIDDDLIAQIKAGS